MKNTYFSPEKAWKHLFFVKGLTADEFYTDGLMKLNIEQMIHMELKRNGYRRVIFYDKDLKLYCYDDESFLLLRVNGLDGGASGTPEGFVPLRKKSRGLKNGKLGKKPEDVQEDEGDEETLQAGAGWCVGEKSGIRIKQIDSRVLHMGMMDDDMVKRQMDAYMDDSMIKTAIVVNDPTTFSRDFEGSLVHSLTAGLERKPAANENIMVFLYTDEELGNLYQVDQYEEEKRTVNLISIGRPNAAEIRNMLQHMRVRGEIRIRPSELDLVAVALHQAMALGKIRIKEAYLRLKNYSGESFLSEEACYEILGQKKPKTAKEQLGELVGMEAVKKKLLSFDVAKEDKVKKMNTLRASRLCPDSEERFGEAEMLHFVLTGNPGTGKTTVAKLIGQLFYEMGYLRTGHVVETERSGLVGEHIGETAVKTRRKVEEALGGVLFIDEAYTLKRSRDTGGDFGQEAIDTLVKLMDQYKGRFIVVAAGYEKEMAVFIDANPGLSRRFPHRLKIDDYGPEEMLKLLLHHIGKRGGVVSEDLASRLPDFCDNWVARAGDNWGNAGEAVNLADELVRNWKNDDAHKVLSRDGKERMLFEAGHIPEGLSDCLRPVSERKKEAFLHLDSLIGFRTVKRKLEELLRLGQTAREQGMEDLLEDLNLHWVLRGNPGTGKTTVAKLIGQVYKEMGLLPKGHTVKVTRADLVAGYVGQTAPKTLRCIERAIGGVLFIDEAYMLSGGQGGNDFGQEAIDTLLEQMSARNGEFAVVTAGYPEEMEQFLDSNPGFRSRFDQDFMLEDYTPAQLRQIFETKCAEHNFRIEESLSEVLEELFEEMKQSRRGRWANGREAENLERALRRQWGAAPCIRPGKKGERERYYTLSHLPEDYKILLEGCEDLPEESGKERIAAGKTEKRESTFRIPKGELAQEDTGFVYERDLLGQTEGVVFIRTLSGKGRNSGSGVVLTHTGYIATCAHVVEDCEDVKIMMKVGEAGRERALWKEASVAWMEKSLDLAILKISGDGFRALPILEREKEVKSGDGIYLWGYPFGGGLSDDLNELRPSVFRGYVSSLQVKGGQDRIYSNMEAKRGCSGGPVFSERTGKVIGLLCGSQASGDDRMMEEINYVLPIRYLWDRISDGTEQGEEGHGNDE